MYLFCTVFACEKIVHMVQFKFVPGTRYQGGLLGFCGSFSISVHGDALLCYSSSSP